MSMVTFNGLLALAGTPAPVVTRLTAAMKQVMDRPDFRERPNKTGNDPAGTTPEEFRQMIQAQSAMWREAIQLSGVKPE